MKKKIQEYVLSVSNKNPETIFSFFLLFSSKVKIWLINISYINGINNSSLEPYKLKQKP